MFDFGDELESFDFQLDPNKAIHKSDGELEDSLDTEIRMLFTDEETQCTETTYELGRNIVRIEKEIKQVKWEINNATDKRIAAEKEISRIRREAEEAVKLQQLLIDDYKQQVFKLRREKTDLERELSEFKKRMEMELQRIKNSSRYEHFISDTDLATADLFWRTAIMEKQLECAQLLGLAKKGICGNGMGTGKTLVALAYADLVKSKKLLIVCPADVTDKFLEESRHWSPHRAAITIYKMSAVERDMTITMLEMLDEFTVLINYDAWRKDATLVPALSRLGFDTMILDEAHTIKNTATAAYKGVKQIAMTENCCPKCNSLKVEDVQIDSTTVHKRYARICNDCGWDIRDPQDLKIGDQWSVKNVLPMTGTPILNKPQELFPLLHLILPDIFVHEKDFLEIYCEQDFYSGYWKFKPGALAKLQVHLGPRYIAMTKEQMGIKLPTQTVIPHYLEIDPMEYPLQYKIITQLTKHAAFVLDSGRKVTALATIELILRKRQANVWPGGIKIYDTDPDGNRTIVYSVDEDVRESIKVDKTVEMCEEYVTAGERTVVFSQFVGGITETCRRLEQREIRAVVFDGSTPRELREAIKRDFSRKYCEAKGYTTRWDVVLCNYRTGGVGLDFTAATQLIVMDEEWNPGRNEQAWARIDRIGQTQDNTVHILRLSSTIDAWMVRLNEHKADVVGGFNNSTMDLAEEMLRAIKGGEML